MNGIFCPFCGSERVQPIARYGTRLVLAGFWCLACHTPFEAIPPEGRGRDATTGAALTRPARSTGVQS